MPRPIGLPHQTHAGAIRPIERFIRRPAPGFCIVILINARSVLRFFLRSSLPPIRVVFLAVNDPEFLRPKFLRQVVVIVPDAGIDIKIQFQHAPVGALIVWVKVPRFDVGLLLLRCQFQKCRVVHAPTQLVVGNREYEKLLRIRADCVIENVQPFLRRIQAAKADAVVRFFGKKQHISGRGKADDRSILRRIERFFAAPIIGTVQDVLFPEHIYAARSRAPTQKRLFRIDSRPFAVRGLEQCQFAVDAVYFIVPGLQPCRGIGIVCRIIHADLCEIRCVGRQYIRRFGFPWRFHRLRCW